MLVSNLSYLQYSNNVLFKGRDPKKAINIAKDTLGPRPSKELLEDLINKGLTNEEIATKLNRAVQTIIGLRCIYKLPSEYELLIQKRTPQIIERLRAGISRKEIAKEFGVCTGTVNLIAEKHKIFDERIVERDKKICELFKAGYKRTEIADIIGVSVDTIGRTLKSFNLSYKSNNRIYDKAILEKLLENESNKQIIEELNISVNPILRVKKENGLTRIYNRLPKDQPIQWTEIMEESKKVSAIRKDFQRLKNGERNLEVLDRISSTLDSLKAKIEEFKSRLEQPLD